MVGTGLDVGALVDIDDDDDDEYDSYTFTHMKPRATNTMIATKLFHIHPHISPHVALCSTGYLDDDELFWKDDRRKS